MAAALGLFVVVVLLGDQRRVEALLLSPEDGEEVPVTLRQVAVTFNVDPNRAAVVERLSVEPEAEGVVRWRGRTMEFVFAGPLELGEHRLTIAPGTLGAGGERLDEAIVINFTVREPGVVLVVAAQGGERLVAVRGEEQSDLFEAERIRDYAISPDGSRIAVVPEVGGAGQLVLIDAGGARTVVDDAGIDIGSVSWSADSNAMLVSRRDRLASGEQSVNRTWLVRITGEFVSQVDPEGDPSLGAVWSPDSQWIAYAAPATGELVALNLSTREERVLGQPRSQTLTWAPDSRLVAFESVPVTQQQGEAPAAPVRVVSVDGAVDVTFGLEGETRLQPRFLGEDVVMTVRRQPPSSRLGTELVFESVSTGTLLRSLLLAPQGDTVMSWDLHPLATQIVYAVQSGGSVVVLVLDLESGAREVVAVPGRLPRWLP